VPAFVQYLVIVAVLGSITAAVFIALPQGSGTLMAIAAVITALAGLIGVLQHQQK
jgi:hypothetical protein